MSGKEKEKNKMQSTEFGLKTQHTAASHSFIFYWKKKSLSNLSAFGHMNDILL